MSKIFLTEYLFNIQETYTSYIKHHNIKTIFIDASNADFLGNEKHLQVVLMHWKMSWMTGNIFLCCRKIFIHSITFYFINPGTSSLFSI